jgi:hypothetical protein
VPKPDCSRYGPAQSGHACGTRARCSCSSGSGRGARRLPVNHERHAAVRAIERPGALPAEDRRREAAAVQQHERLLAAIEAQLNRRAKRAAEDDVGPLDWHTPLACPRPRRTRADGRGCGARARRAAFPVMAL